MALNGSFSIQQTHASDPQRLLASSQRTPGLWRKRLPVAKDQNLCGWMIGKG